MDDSNSLVIVAIPEVDDHVWKISSEKVPHMTLLFLGDQAGPEHIARIQDYIQHCVNIGTVTRFGANVDRRGLLGPDEADVVFFEKVFALEDVAKFRDTLLQQDDIKNLYNSVQQFPGWTPHLTLGYPATPAHADTREYPGVHYVNFDKIALWTADSAGLEFPLQSRNMEVSMDALSPAEKILAHFGVKGMRWGVRKSRSGGGPEAITTRHKPGQKVTASGGAGRPAHEDAKRAVALGQKAKKSTTHSLSNDELQELLKRIDMENRYVKLNPKKKNPAVDFATKLLVQYGQQELQKVMKGDLSTVDQVSALLGGAGAGKHRKK